MRIHLEPTTDGRWQIWLEDWPEDYQPAGVWGGTYTPRACAARVKELLGVLQTSRRDALRKQLKATSS